MKSDNRVALVTGGGSGIGPGICERSAREGATIAVVDIDHARGEHDATGIRQDELVKSATS